MKKIWTMRKIINCVNAGEPRDAGILPRALDVLFNSINNKQVSGYDLKPKMFMDVVKLNKEEADEEKRLKDKTLKLSNDEVLQFYYSSILNSEENCMWNVHCC